MGNVGCDYVVRLSFYSEWDSISGASSTRMAGSQRHLLTFVLFSPDPVPFHIVLSPHILIRFLVLALVCTGLHASAMPAALYQGGRALR